MKTLKIDYETLKRMRVMNGITQKELAKELGVTRNYLSMIENGNQSYSEETGNKILSALYVLIQYKGKNRPRKKK